MARSSEHPYDEHMRHERGWWPGEEREWAEQSRDYQTLKALGFRCLPDEVLVAVPGGRVAWVVPVEELEDEAA